MKPLIWIESVIEKFSHSRVEIMVKVTILVRARLKPRRSPQRARHRSFFF